MIVAVSGMYVKNKSHDIINLTGELRIYNCEKKDEAAKHFEKEMKEKYPEHTLVSALMIAEIEFSPTCEFTCENFKYKCHKCLRANSEDYYQKVTYDDGVIH